MCKDGDGAFAFESVISPLMYLEFILCVFGRTIFVPACVKYYSLEAVECS